MILSLLHLIVKWKVFNHKFLVVLVTLIKQHYSWRRNGTLVYSNCGRNSLQHYNAVFMKQKGWKTIWRKIFIITEKLSKTKLYPEVQWYKKRSMMSAAIHLHLLIFTILRWSGLFIGCWNHVWICALISYTMYIHMQNGFTVSFQFTTVMCNTFSLVFFHQGSMAIIGLHRVQIW